MTERSTGLRAIFPGEYCERQEGMSNVLPLNQDMIDFSEKKLHAAWKEIYSNKPQRKRKYSRGIDGVTMEQFEEEKGQRIKHLHRQLKDGSFVFDQLYHYQEERPSKKSRDIQAPTVTDRIVQKIISDYLVSSDFREPFSQAGVVGTKGNKVRDVMDQLLKAYDDGYVYALKTDLIDYFPSINPKRLRRIIGQYVKNKEAKKYIWKYLSVSTLPGIPQGPPLSPLMANLYLLGLDKKLASMKSVRHIRYVDDIVVLVRSEKEAKKIYSTLVSYLNRVGVKIHPFEDGSKTIIERFDSGKIDALGVIYRDGKLYIKPKKLSQFREDFINPIRWIKVRDLRKGQNKEDKVANFIQYFNLKLHGWGTAYSFCNVKELYEKLDETIQKNFTIFLKYNRVKDWEIYLQLVARLSDIKLKPLIKHD
jgi:RNA-directed DNA polymerase